MSFDEQKTSTATKEDLIQNTTDISVVMQRQVLVIQKAQKTVCFSTVTRPSTGTAQVMHDEVQRNPWTKDAFSIPQDREQDAECLRH